MCIKTMSHSSHCDLKQDLSLNPGKNKTSNNGSQRFFWQCSVSKWVGESE